jgi:hypothetical protein
VVERMKVTVEVGEKFSRVSIQLILKERRGGKSGVLLIRRE